MIFLPVQNTHFCLLKLLSCTCGEIEGTERSHVHTSATEALIRRTSNVAHYSRWIIPEIESYIEYSL